MVQSSVLLRVQFIHGDPTDLEDDDFFVSKIDNMLISDDVVSGKGKERRITDLPTKGFRHRFPSTGHCMGIRPRINCHYLKLLHVKPMDQKERNH